ncbi:MAG: peptidoglycan lytic transglycosylase, Glycoside Hydrolase Family 23-like protein [Ramlibacter sp.]|nr:peptidoglycan lytic transglycosylase, Glycoside Hydrolase Family 23-like protein [Ramlibacter sp.]
MKLFPLAAAALVLWLSGCASIPQPAPATSAQRAAATPSAAAAGTAPLQPVIPGGPLQPITTADLASSQDVAGMQVPADLWDRIRRGFKMNDLEGDLVRQQEQWYTSRPDYIQRMTERSSKYLFHIVEELERRNMPSELALLPFIESAFNPQAVSTARAAGMWQFMPATGTYFELKQNVFRDDRRDVLASTRAALDYLQKLYGMFGDWHLALAAYNWGEGNVGRAIARNQKTGQGLTYADLNMPNETRYYVPKLQAVKNIIADPQTYRTELPLIENHPYFQSVKVTRDIDVELAARLANVKLEDFKALNPSMKRPVILAAGTPEILLPWDNAQVFERNFDAYSKGQFASWTAWSAPATMTVAEAARRIGMNENELRSANTIPPRMLIKGGSVLIVPRTPQQQNDVTSHMADNGQLDLTPEIVTRRTVVRAGKRETVASVARRYGLQPGQVAGWNNVLASAAFKPGQQVVVFLPVKAQAAHRPGREQAVRVPARSGVKPVVRARPVAKVPARKQAPPAKRR